MSRNECYMTITAGRKKKEVYGECEMRSSESRVRDWPGLCVCTFYFFYLIGSPRATEGTVEQREKARRE